MKFRARLKRQTMERGRYVYLDGLGRVERGSVVVFAVRHPHYGRKPFVFGWVKADCPNPLVNWGRPA